VCEFRPPATTIDPMAAFCITGKTMGEICCNFIEKFHWEIHHFLPFLLLLLLLLLWLMMMK